MSYILFVSKQKLIIRKNFRSVDSVLLETKLLIPYNWNNANWHKSSTEQIWLSRKGILLRTVHEIKLDYTISPPDRVTYFFDIVAGVLPGDTFTQYLFIVCQGYVLRTSRYLMKENGIKLKKGERQTLSCRNSNEQRLNRWSSASFKCT